MTVRASAVLALGELFGASALAPSLSESAHSTGLGPNANASVGLQTPLQKGYPGMSSSSSSSSSSTFSTAASSTMSKTGANRPLPSPAISSSVLMSPFGVSAAALSAQGQNQGQGQSQGQGQGQGQGQSSRFPPEGSLHSPSPSEYGVFGALSVQHPSSLMNPTTEQSYSTSTAYAYFQGRRVSVLSVEQMELLEAELLLAIQLLESCTDGSVLVRREAVIALSKFVILPHHVSCIKVVASGLLLETRVARTGVSTPSAQTSSKGLMGALDLKEKENVASSGSSGSGTLSARSNPSTSATISSSNNISSSSPKLPDENTNQGKSAPMLDPWQLSISQSQIIVDRLAKYLQCVGYPSLPAKSDVSPSTSTGAFSTADSSTAPSVEMRQPIPKLPSQISTFPNLREGSTTKKSMPTIPTIGEKAHIAYCRGKEE